MDAKRLARYPFLPEAGRWAADEGPDVPDLLESAAWQRARQRAQDRVDAALDPETNPKVPEPDYATAGEPILEVLSYGVARMIVSAVDRNLLVRRYAEAEAKAAHDRLVDEGEVGLLDVARRLDLEARRVDGELGMHVASYLSHLKGIREDDRRLVNQDVVDGMVLLEADAFARLTQEAVRNKILDELPMPTNATIEEGLADRIKRVENKARTLASELEPEPLGEADLDLIPPCMEALLAQLQAGENVPHQGRFALTAFLHKIGMTADEIMDLFKAAPDFREDVTRYQVEHITGHDQGEGYTPPACATMVTYGLCVNKDKLCEHINHPLSYYRVKYEDRHQDEDGGDGEPAEDEASGDGT